MTSSLVDPFAHYQDRYTLEIKENARLVSNSEVQTFKRCRRKWWLMWYRGLRLRRQSPTGPRAIGDRIHRALSLWYVPNPADRIDPREALERLIAEDWRQLDLADSEYAAGAAIDFNKDASLERAMLEGYVEWLAETGADSEIAIISSEQYVQARFPIHTELSTFPVYIIGKFDVRVRRITDLALLFIDHKTVADFSRKIMTLRMDEQMLHYMLLELLGVEDSDERCDGAIYNMMRRVKRTVKAKPPFYQRTELRHNSHEIASYTERLTGTIEDILATEQQLNHGVSHYRAAYPRPTTDCSWDCDMVAVCPLFDDGSRAEDMLTQYYDSGDPLSYYHRDLVIKDEGSEK